MTAEQAEILGWFTTMLRDATADGGRKRAAGLKPSWKVDTSHRAAIFSHLNKWEHGEKVDADSGQHPLVHLAWRALAIAWQETNGAAMDKEIDEHIFGAPTCGQAYERAASISSENDAVARELDKRARNRVLD